MFNFEDERGELEGYMLDMNFGLDQKENNAIAYGSFSPLCLSIIHSADPRSYCNFSGVKLEKC